MQGRGERGRRGGSWHQVLSPAAETPCHGSQVPFGWQRTWLARMPPFTCLLTLSLLPGPLALIFIIFTTSESLYNEMISQVPRDCAYFLKEHVGFPGSPVAKTELPVKVPRFDLWAMANSPLPRSPRTFPGQEQKQQTEPGQQGRSGKGRQIGRASCRERV